MKLNELKTHKSFAKNYRIVCEPDAPAFNKIKVRSSSEIADFIRTLYGIGQDLEIVESFFIVLLNQAQNITGWVKISSGGLTGTVADPVLVAKYAIEQLAKGVVIAHNHPSGNLQPSRADEDITKRIKDGLKLFDISLLDHIILTEDSFYSFEDEGMLY